MKKKLLGVWIYVVAVLLCGCSVIPIDNEADLMMRIESPRSEEKAIYGTWNLIAIEAQTENNENKKVNYEVGDKMHIDAQLVTFMDKYTVNPSYSAKYVNYKAYLEYKKEPEMKLRPYDQNSIEIFTIRDGQNFLLTLLKLDEDHVAISYNADTLYFEKEKDTVDPSIVGKYKSEYLSTYSVLSPGVTKKYDLALLLGVRSLVSEKEGLPFYEYHTYLIRSDSTSTPKIYKISDLFLPRSNGFWIAGIHREEMEDQKTDTLFIHPVSVDKTKEMSKYTSPDRTLKHITYIGDRFVSLEWENLLSEKELQYTVHSIDALNENKPLDVVDIAGKESLAVFHETMMREEKPQAEDPLQSEYTYNSKNIGVTRNRGRWTFRSGIETEIDGEKAFKAFVVDLVPDVDIFRFDKLAIPWSEIKTLHPSATDAFSSPHEEVCLIQNPDEILMYQIQSGRIKPKPICALPVKPNDKIVMIEWGLESYAESWEQEFKNQELQPVQYTSY